MAEQRKSYYVASNFQKNFLLFTSGITVFYAGSLFFANQLFFRYYMARGQELNFDAEHPYFDVLIAQKGFLNMVSISLAIVFIAATWFFGLRLTHRVAGPIQKMQKSVEDWSQGAEPQEIQLRKDDFFQELAEALNRFIKSRR